MQLIQILVLTVEYKRTGFPATLFSIADLILMGADVRADTFELLGQLHANYSTVGPT